jgi:hypothetical protein
MGVATLTKLLRESVDALYTLLHPERSANRKNSVLKVDFALQNDVQSAGWSCRGRLFLILTGIQGGFSNFRFYRLVFYHSHVLSIPYLVSLLSSHLSPSHAEHLPCLREMCCALYYM